MIAVLAAAAIAFVLIGPTWRVAMRFGWADRPAPHKPHAVITPYLGGVVVLAATIPVTGLLAREWTLPLLALMIGVICVGVLGLADDLRQLSPGLRLVAESVVAVALVACGLRASITGSVWVDSVLTVCWLVVIVNSMNLLDNSDAALPVITVVSAACLSLAAPGGFGTLLLSATGATAAFLSYNWPPARMFLGDAGSLSLGLLLAGSAVAASNTLPAGPPTISWLLLATFVAVTDTATVVISRLRARRSLLAGGADHLAHRLQRLGLSKAASALVLGTISLSALAAGHLVLSGQNQGWPTVTGVVAAASVIAVTANFVSGGYRTVSRLAPVPDQDTRVLTGA